jgi:hypothetical protein
MRDIFCLRRTGAAPAGTPPVVPSLVIGASVEFPFDVLPVVVLPLDLLTLDVLRLDVLPLFDVLPLVVDWGNSLSGEAMLSGAAGSPNPLSAPDSATARVLVKQSIARMHHKASHETYSVFFFTVINDCVAFVVVIKRNQLSRQLQISYRRGGTPTSLGENCDKLVMVQVINSTPSPVRTRHGRSSASSL